MNSKEYTLPNGKKAVFEYDVCGIGKVTLECMDELMAMITDRPHEVVANGNCAICGKPLSGDRVFICEECSKKGADDE